MVTTPNFSRPLKWTWSGTRFTRQTPRSKRFENQEPSLRDKRARFYAAQLGRFISRDPLGFVDGFSLYRAYFVPVGVDPWGLQEPTVPLPPGYSTPVTEYEHLPRPIPVSGGGLIACPVGPMIPAPYPGPPMLTPDGPITGSAPYFVIDRGTATGLITRCPWGPLKKVKRDKNICYYERTREVSQKFVYPYKVGDMLEEYIPGGDRAVKPWEIRKWTETQTFTKVCDEWDPCGSLFYDECARSCPNQIDEFYEMPKPPPKNCSGCEIWATGGIDHLQR